MSADGPSYVLSTLRVKIDNPVYERLKGKKVIKHKKLVFRGIAAEYARARPIMNVCVSALGANRG